MRKLIALVTFVAALTVLLPAHSSQSSDFTTLLARYRGANADAAVREFATWSNRRYESEANLTTAQRADPWTAAALALLYLETDLHRLGIEKGIDSALADGTYKPFEIGVSLVLRGQRLLGDVVLPWVSQSGDLGLAAFCRDWLVVRHTALPGGIWGEAMEKSWRDLAEQYFFDDPQMATILGIVQAKAMGPFAYGGRLELGENNPKGGVITAGGRTYFAINARDAEIAFQRALTNDASIVEARLRLGRLYQAIGRTREAHVELTLA